MKYKDKSLDELDLRIIQQLQEDSSLSNQALAMRVHASPPTCLRRVKRLNDIGVIERQVAIITPAAVGLNLQAIVEISLDRQNSEAQLAFANLVTKEPAVLQCYQVSPGPDFVVIIAVPDMAAYHALASRLFSSHSNVRNVRSFFVQQRVKFETRVLAAAE